MGKGLFFSIMCPSWHDLSFMTRLSCSGIKQTLTGHLYLNIRQMDVASIFLHNLTVDDVVAILILNRIPPSWVVHGYPYSAQYIRKCIWANSMDSTFFQEVDVEHL